MAVERSRLDDDPAALEWFERFVRMGTTDDVLYEVLNEWHAAGRSSGWNPMAGHQPLSLPRQMAPQTRLTAPTSPSTAAAAP